MPGSLLENVYYKMPVYIQNGLFSIYGLHLSRKRYNRFFYKYFERLKETEWWSKAKIQDYQNENAVRIVRHAYETIPFYHKWYDDYGVNIDSIKSVSDLKNLPILTKQMVRTHQDEMISTSFSKKALVKILTSGTTGTPLSIFQTSEGLAFQWAVWWRHKSRFGLKLKDSHLTFGARVPIGQNQLHPPYWRKDFFNNRVYLSTYHISKKTVKDIATYLNSTHFKFFTGYPSAMYHLAVLMEESGLYLKNKPDYVVSGSDALQPGYEELISRVFGTHVTEQYGMAEFAGNMSKCQNDKFHEDFECCSIEKEPIDGSEYYRLIMTGWGNQAMPFIRYEVGDYAVPSDSICSCGRQSQSYVSVNGRLEDYIVTPDGRKLIGMNQVFEYADNVQEAQIYQRKREEIEFRIIPRIGFDDNDKKVLIREFKRRGGKGINIKFTIVDRIELSPSGKFKAVVSEII